MLKFAHELLIFLLHIWVDPLLNFNRIRATLKGLQSLAAILIRSTLFCDISQRRVVILYRRFGTTSIKDYQSMLRNIPEDRRTYSWGGGVIP
jgi:hypothetical protein